MASLSMDTVLTTFTWEPITIRMLGLMASVSSVLQLGLLHMRPLQYWLKPRVPPHTWHHGRHHCLSGWARPALQLWPLGRTSSGWNGACPWAWSAEGRLVLTDASNLGRGALCDDKSAFGPWSKKDGYLHINCLELLAVWLGLRTFLPDLRGHHVLIHSDSVTVVSYINHQSVFSSRRLFTL